MHGIPTGLALLLLCSFVQSLPAVSYTKAWTSYEANTVFVKSKKIVSHDDGFLFALCKTSSNLNILNCNVTLDKPTAYETCSVMQSSSTGSESGTDLSITDLQHFGNKVFMTWLEGLIRHISILHMVNCSISHVIKYDLNHAFKIDPIFHEKGFDIFVRDEILCGDQLGTCWISYDTTGQRVSEPMLLHLNFTQATVLPIGASLVEGYFAYGRKELRLFEIERVSSNNTVTTILKDKVLALFMYETQTSKAHELFGLCWFDLDHLEIHCSQYDINGVSTINLTALSLPQSETLVGVHNLSNGAMLLITKTKDDDFGYNVRKIFDSRVGKPAQFGHRYLQTTDFKMTVVETGNEFVFYFCGVKNHYEDNNDLSASDFRTILTSKKGRIVQSDLIYEVTRVPKKYVDDVSI